MSTSLLLTSASNNHSYHHVPTKGVHELLSFKTE